MENRYIPKEGTLENCYERLFEYINSFDKDFINRIEPAKKGLMEKLERISNNKAPKIYREFFKYMGESDDSLIEELFGSINHNMISSLKGLMESYQMTIWDYPNLFEKSNCLGIYVDDFEGIELSLDISKDSLNPPIYSTEWLLVKDDEKEFYSKSLECLLFQAVFYRYEKYRNKVFMSFYRGFYESKVEDLLKKHKVNSLETLINKFLEKHNIEKVWFSDKKHYIGSNDNISIFLTTVDECIDGFLSVYGSGSDVEEVKKSLINFFDVNVKVLNRSELYRKEVEKKLKGKSLSSISINGSIDKDDIEFIGITKHSKTLEIVEIPKGIPIPDDTFSHCINLKEVINLDKSIEIGDSAFSNCESLEKVYLDSVELIEYKAFEECKNLKEVLNMKNLKRIGAYAFMGCELLERIDFPENIGLIIDIKSFMFCSELRYITNLDKVKIIGIGAFAFCDSLEKVDLHPEIELDESAFIYCMSLKEIKNLNKLKVIKKQTFEGCLSLEKIDLREEVILEKGAFRRCESLKEIGGINSVSKIESGVFSYCYSLEEIELPINIEIEEEAFLACKSLKEVRNLDKIKVIKASTFERCESLERIVLGENVIIEENAFKGCKNLKEVVNLDKAKSVAKTAFEGCELLNLQ